VIEIKGELANVNVNANHVGEVGVSFPLSDVCLP
jgi:hypothetical protein